jgi:hypothetical protein
MTIDPSVADTPDEDRPEHPGAVTEAVTDAAQPGRPGNTMRSWLTLLNLLPNCGFPASTR